MDTDQYKKRTLGDVIYGNWKWILFVLTVSLFFSTIILLLATKEPERELRVANFSMYTDTERIIKMEEYLGEPLILYFWAAWCHFCREEMPDLEQIQGEYKERGLNILGVHRSTTEDFDVGVEFARELGVTYPLGQDHTGSIFNHFARGSFVTPMTVFIDEEGYVKETIIGPRNINKLRNLTEDRLFSN